jgi:uncharacterized protein YecT (DUF1311 family)
LELIDEFHQKNEYNSADNSLNNSYEAEYEPTPESDEEQK